MTDNSRIPERLCTIFKEINPELQEHLLKPTTTIEEMDLLEPLGHAVLLELKDKMEREFHVRFAQDELPDFFESGRVTYQQLIDAVAAKLSATTEASC